MQVVTLPKIQGIKRVAVVTYCKNDWIVWSDPDSIHNTSHLIFTIYNLGNSLLILMKFLIVIFRHSDKVFFIKLKNTLFFRQDLQDYLDFYFSLFLLLFLRANSYEL